MTAGPAVGWVGETDARTQTDVADARRAVVPGDGALRHAGGDRDAARRLRGQHRRVDRAARSSRRSPSRRAPPSSPATAPTSRRASSHYTTVANASWAWGNIGYIATGAAGAFPATDPSDVLVDLVYALKAGYRQNGSFVMNRKTQAAIRKFKDAERQLSLAAAGAARAAAPR